MKILVTGANCFIGFPLVNRLLSLDHELYVVIRPGNSKKEYFENLKNTTVIELSLEDYSKLNLYVNNIDAAVLLAWNGTRSQTRFDEELQRSNYLYNLSAIKSLISVGCKKILTAGSQAEYGIIDGIIDENTICNPNTAYGNYKLKLYKEAFEICKKNNVSFKEPRFFSLYGAGDYENTLIMSNIRKMLNNEDCEMTLCTQMWDFLYIDDAVDAIVSLIEKDCADGAYNFGSGDHRELKSYVKEMKEVLNSSSNLLFGAVEYTKAGKVSIQPCIDKLKHEIGFKPKVSFEEGIKMITQICYHRKAIV